MSAQFGYPNSGDNNVTESTTTIPAVEETIGQLLMGALYDEITNLRVMWPVMPQREQQDLLDRLRKHVDEVVRIAVRRLATEGFPHVVAEIDSMAIKDDAKVALVLPRGSAEAHTLLDHVKSKVILVFADPQQYTDGMEQFKTQLDQPPLPLE